MESVSDHLFDLLRWAWSRHANPLSWYIRPLFFLPLAYFAWCRKGWGLALTLVALLTSFFWFPAPESPDPRIQGVLDMERAFLAHPGPFQALMLCLAPLMLAGFCAALWHRSLGWGIVIFDAAALGKIVWAVAEAGGDGTATCLPVGGGALFVTVLLVIAARRKDIPLSLR
ncbi:hypothetical protein V1L54_13350 [Streptomyces sp. TRM 70361]|uniref:hypothetical protein n=1 Tax=Streptomyces sp. TRM 70361 TaxID=3116553 RepID=UPI002E7B7FF4|nr:hypothetical protein [Streptomyces sp. TRM 70361]MEE1940378.1 hypothetical protein [Streptomyces sp. TRM 70361]